MLAALNATRRVLQAVVVCPSKELGVQIVDVMHSLAPRELGIEVLPVFDECKNIKR
jgi:superfamily II DNA/RNA helicase